MKKICLELCVESVHAGQSAQAGGADRIELCERLSVGGVTPAADLLAATVRSVTIPIHVLIRPRDGDFVFSPHEFDVMKQQIEQAKKAGAAGVAVGVLLTDGRVDVTRTRELIKLSRPLKATFHRAFDETPDVFEALDHVVATGADCLLTSGGERDVLEGAEAIARLRERAGKHLDVMAGGGLTLRNLTEVVRTTGVEFLHGSLTRRDTNQHPAALNNGHTATSRSSILEADVREAVRLFRETLDATARPRDRA
jgi:copper homeostasis protein